LRLCLREVNAEALLLYENARVLYEAIYEATLHLPLEADEARDARGGHSQDVHQKVAPEVLRVLLLVPSSLPFLGELLRPFLLLKLIHYNL